MKDPNWEAMCKALYWTVELGSSADLEPIMEYIEKHLDREDDDE